MTNEQKARAALQVLIAQYDGPTGLARAMGNGITRQMIEKWDLIPLSHLRITKARFGLGLKELRPDIAEYL